MSKIDMMIIGAQKAGTTSLKNYLFEHSQIVSHLPIEFGFFSDDKEYSEGFEKHFKRYFTLKDGYKKVVAKIATAYAEPTTLERIKAHNPDCQIVLIIRNPVERAYSSYLMEVSRGGMPGLTFSTVIKNILKKPLQELQEDILYKVLIDYGLYYKHLQLIYQFFPPKQVHIILFDELKKDALNVCRRMFDILEVDNTFEPHTEVVHNKAKAYRSASVSVIVNNLRQEDNKLKKIIKKILPYNTFTKIGTYIDSLNRVEIKPPQMDEPTRQRLIAYYKPHNQALEKELGIDLSYWDK
jgi:hypothetical protein